MKRKNKVTSLPFTQAKTYAIEALEYRVLLTLPFGTQLGSFNGVPDYSNNRSASTVSNVYYAGGTGTGVVTGIEWQSVEFVNRYYYAVNGKNIRIVGENANQYYGDAATKGLISYANGGSVPPQVGDILCFGGGSDGSGHVAIIRSIGSSTATVIQQNVTNGDFGPNGTDASYNFSYNPSTNIVDVLSSGSSHLGSTYYCQGWLRLGAVVTNNPPTISSFTDSPDPIMAGNTMTLAVNASDSDGSVSAVNFYRETDGSGDLEIGSDLFLGSDSSSPFSLNISTAGLSGEYKYYASAVDDQGALSNYAKTVNTVTAPPVNQPPAISSFTDSPDPVTAGNIMTLSVSASDSDGTISAVNFYRETDGTAGLGIGSDLLLGSDSSSPFSLSINTSGLAGSYSYYASAVDNQGAVSNYATTTNNVTAVPANQPPAITLFTDSPDPVVAGNTMTLSASAGDPDGSVSKVNFYRESNNTPGFQAGSDIFLSGVSTYPYQFDVNTAGLSGRYTYYAEAFDDHNASSTVISAVNTVQVNNTVPTINSFSASPDPVVAGDTMTLSVSAGDSDGSVAAVNFYRETDGIAGLGIGSDVFLGSNSSNPFTLNIDTAGLSGTCIYYASAVDNQGALSNYAMTVNTVNAAPVNQAPKIIAFIDSPDPVTQGTPVTLSADASDSDGSVSEVNFYRETDGVAGLGISGDLFLGSDNSSPFSLSVNITGLSGTSTYYAVAVDNQGAMSDYAETTNTVKPNVNTSISINDVSAFEGTNSLGTKPFMFTVSLDKASDTTVTVNYATADGTATLGDNDYIATSGTLMFDPGETSETITVPVVGDTKVENDETFFVNLSSPTNATIFDGQGQATAKNDDAAALPAQKPYHGTPYNISNSAATIQFEDFDLGGEGVAYHDLSSTNTGGAYRTGEAVDIKSVSTTPANYRLSDAFAGEWLEYTVNVASSEKYDFDFHVSNTGTGGLFHLELDPPVSGSGVGTNLTGSLAVPNTGNLNTFASVKKTGVSLSAGSHVFRIVLDQQSAASSTCGGFDLFTIAPTPPPPAGSISGEFFADNNGNAKLDSGEAGLNGWVAYIDKNKNGKLDSGETSIKVDSSGKYNFSKLDAGAYRIAYSGQSGYRQTTSASYYDITLPSNTASSSNNNFGLTQRVLISGTVFNDADGNKSKASSEKGLTGWKVFLDTDGDGVLDSNERYVTTDSSGNWSFKDLLANTTYKVRVQQQSGYKLTTSSSTYSIKLAVGATATGKLFGEKKI